MSQPLKNATEVVYSDFYQQQLKNQQLKNPKFPELANAFLCLSLIYENAGEYVEAGWVSVYAAWTCDDVSSVEGATKCRKKAVVLFQKARKNGQMFADSDEEEDAILVDLLRRAGEFDLALKTYEKGLKKQPKGLIFQILEFQKKLIGRRWPYNCRSKRRVI